MHQVDKDILQDWFTDTWHLTEWRTVTDEKDRCMPLVKYYETKGIEMPVNLVQINQPIRQQKQ